MRLKKDQSCHVILHFYTFFNKLFSSYLVFFSIYLLAVAVLSSADLIPSLLKRLRPDVLLVRSSA